MNELTAPLTLGSLFSGSGGFELAGILNGITPLWASEIEKYPMAVTKARFPQMQHLGDVREINGAAVAPVDIITFGSPCQDMSVAGKRAGLDGSRSSLFHEAMRIIREMREATHGKYPRYAVWENVPGAFSSNKGWDFKAVLEAFCATGGYTIPIPKPEQRKDKLVWRNAGSIMGYGFSVAWRTFDAQYWGVPQRRRRIYLVADFAGGRAGEILFDPEGVRGHYAPGGETGQGVAGDADGGAGGSVFNESGQGYWMPGFGCLRAEGESRPSRPGHVICQPDIFHTLTAANVRCVESAQRPNCVAIHQNASGEVRAGSVANTLSTNSNASGRNTPLACYRFRGYGDYVESEIASTQRAAHDQTTADMVVIKGRKYIVRRLTPVECARLQGFPERLEIKEDIMTRDEWIALNLTLKNIIVDCENGEVYATRGPGGVLLSAPKKLKGTILPSGYRVVSLRIGESKKQCRVNRVVAMAGYGYIPKDYVVDHIDNDKLNDRLDNLQFLTPKENSTKAKFDGRYKCGDDAPSSKVPVSLHKEIVWIYENTDHTQKELAMKYGISESRIQQIISMYTWGDIDDKKLQSDAAQYRMWGNGIALPCAAYVMRGIGKVHDGETERQMRIGG